MTNTTNIGIPQRPFAGAAFVVTTATPLLVGVGTNAVIFPLSADDVMTGYTVELDGTGMTVGFGVSAVSVAIAWASALM